MTIHKLLNRTFFCAQYSEGELQNMDSVLRTAHTKPDVYAILLNSKAYASLKKLTPCPVAHEPDENGVVGNLEGYNVYYAEDETPDQFVALYARDENNMYTTYLFEYS